MHPLIHSNITCALRPFSVGIICFLLSMQLFGQNTTIRGFADTGFSVLDDKFSFYLGEQDLFITSELNDRISFLGETVFKFDFGSSTEFSVGVERIILKYNYKGNHNILIGKHHTPINYWNDTYHHGRLFFPTIDRPLLFAAGIVPLHTLGIGFQAQNLGNLRFGYDVMIGNGIGSTEVLDNDQHKSWTAAVHIKPVDKLRLGASYYNDVISKGADAHHHVVDWQVNQQLLTGSVAYFGKKYELLTEFTLALNHTDTTGTAVSNIMYLYGGYRLTEKWIPYFRIDYLKYGEGEIYFDNDNTTAFLLGLRYQINYLAVVKLEYQVENFENNESINRIKAQIAVGF